MKIFSRRHYTNLCICRSVLGKIHFWVSNVHIKYYSGVPFFREFFCGGDDWNFNSTTADFGILKYSV